MRHPARWNVPTEYQIRITVAGEIRGADACWALYRERLTTVHAESLRTAPENKTPIAKDLRHHQVEPAIIIEINKMNPARTAVGDTVVGHFNPIGIFRIETLGVAVKNQQLRVVPTAEDQIEIAVAIEVRATCAVRPRCRQYPTGVV